nr:uncharacterized protein LOC129448832 isoform X2 [Misgurnus anguillicaudatus]
MWTNGLPVLLQVPGYQGRISVTATQLTITNSQLSDSGTYSVSVEPSASSGLGVNTQSIQLKVLDAVNGVTLSLPGVPQEGKNMSLLCKWSAGTDVNVLWGKGGAALSSDTRITINGGSLVISPASRDDSGQYTCTVNNSVSARTASSSLSVYYGPDAPQLNKTSSACVGGGDATVGQTVRLTCTSASLPPASFSWELNGQPVTAGQSGTGVLNLQIYSTSQGGRYTCTARNDITGATSAQQIDVVIVGTCLSGGAVAGIVIACFVALLIIIIVIIVLLRQRKVDQRVKEAFELQKANQNNGHMVSVPPLHDNNTLPVNGNLNNSSSQNQQIFTSLPNNSNGNIHAAAQNGLGNTNPLRHNGHLSTDAFQHNLSALSNNDHPNTLSYPNNSRSNPQPVQQNPNILIQTGNSQPGAPVPTVHVNLSTLPNTDQHISAQPHTVNVNLNTYPPEASQPSHRNADPRESTVQRQHANPNLLSPSQGGSPRSDNPAQTGVDDALMNRSHQPSGLIQTSYSHPSNQTDTRRRPDNSQSSREEHPRRSNPTQMPWDILRGTPAYPNPQIDSSDSSGSLERQLRSPRDTRGARSGQRHRVAEPPTPQVNSSDSGGSSERQPRSPRDTRGARSGQRHRVAEPASGVNQTAPAARGRDPQRSVAPNHSQISPDVQNIIQS